MAEQPAAAGEANQALNPLMPPGSYPADISSFTRSGAVIVKNRYLIDLDTPIPGLDMPNASAFAASDRYETGAKLFALICAPGLPARVNIISSIKGDSPRGLLTLVDHDAVYWPPLRQSTMAVLYRRPLGGRVSGIFNSKDIRINEHDVSQLIIDPLTAGLGALSFRNITHRAIRPQNIFFSGEGKSEGVLGDCATSPPGFDQPVIFETIERGMASAWGRGDAGISEDIYALGVTVAFLINHGNPLEGLSEADILRVKIEYGSYTALCGKMHIPSNLIEALRGMLSDDRDERWNLEQISSWINGQRRTPIQKKAAAKTDIPFVFAGKAHVTLRTLAYAFTKDVKEAAKVIKAPELAEWLRRSFHSQKLSDLAAALTKLSIDSQGKPQGEDDYIVAKMSMALDPKGPVRYKGMSFMPDAFGSFLAVESLRQGGLPGASEILNHDIIAAWFAEQGEYDPEAIAIEKFFGQLKKTIANKDMGGGVERILYELNPSLPCKSPIIAEDYVIYIEDLLPALDNAANRVDAKTDPMDRHVAAFIAARFERDIAPHLAALSSPERPRFIIGMLSLLAFLQWSLKLESLLGLSSWLGGLLGPSINAYHSRITRREIEKEIPRLVRKGSLPELFDLIDNVEKRKNDNNGFFQAKTVFAAAEAEIRKIEEGGDARKAGQIRTAQKAAAMCSILISMVIIMLLGMFKSW